MWVWMALGLGGVPWTELLQVTQGGSRALGLVPQTRTEVVVLLIWVEAGDHGQRALVSKLYPEHAMVFQDRDRMTGENMDLEG